MILFQPDKLKIIRVNPIYDDVYIILEQLDDAFTIIKQLAEAPQGYSVPQAFAYFSNEGLIKPKGWLQTDTFEGLDNATPYYGSNLK